MKQSEWVLMFLVPWTAAIAAICRAFGVIDTEVALSAPGMVVMVFILNVTVRQARESVSGKPAPRYHTPWWLGKAITWQFVAACALVGAWLGYGIGPWIGAVGGTMIMGGAGYCVAALVASVWEFIDVMLFFASMAPDPRDPNRAR